MKTLSLDSVKAAIAAAFDKWLDQQPYNFSISLEGENVVVTIALRGDSFDCGIPGYQLAYADEANLRQWVPNGIEKNGNRAYVSPVRNDFVNVWLKGGVYVMFNFHLLLAKGQ